MQSTSTGGCPNYQFMAQPVRENRVTLPSVKTNYTERSGAYEKEKKELCIQGQEIGKAPCLSGGVSAADGSAFPGGGLQQGPASRAVRGQRPFYSALGSGLPSPWGRGSGAEATHRQQEKSSG